MKNLKKDKLYIQVFDEIRKYIIANKIEPGERLPTEHEMCEMLGVSRNVLREAIKALEIIGVLKSKPGRGIVVQEFNMDFLFQNIFYYLVADSNELINEILQIRKVLELGFHKEAFELITDVEIEELEDILIKMEEKHRTNCSAHDEDMLFHITLFKKVNNRTLNSVLEAAWNVDKGFNPDVKNVYPIEFLNNHKRIHMALKNRDYESFKNEIEKHFSEGTFRE